MTEKARRHPDDQVQEIVQRASAEGFQLVQLETSHGQLVWEWQRGDEARPQFVSHRVALNFMEDWLRRNATAHHRLRLRRHASR